MRFADVSVPEIYKSSMDFRFFQKWFEVALQHIKYDLENLFDLYDPQRCPAELLWMLADTIGFKYDNRFPAAYNRLILIYFMSMIRNRGSKDGVTLAAETNLAQFNLLKQAQEKSELYDRLEDTSIPVNAVSVQAHTPEGYIDVIYFSNKKPVDACLEYVRPLGMYIFQNTGVKFNARTKISVDARLINLDEEIKPVGPTHVGHYRRDDFARMQKGSDFEADLTDTRRPTNYRNTEGEGQPVPEVDPGYRALYSLQLCNNVQVVQALLDPIFSVGFGPQDVNTVYPDSYLKEPEWPEWNLRYDKKLDYDITPDTYVLDDYRTENVIQAKPLVNPRMCLATLGDSIQMTPDTWTKTDPYPIYHIINPNEGVELISEDDITFVDIDDVDVEGVWNTEDCVLEFGTGQVAVTDIEVNFVSLDEYEVDGVYDAGTFTLHFNTN